MSWLGPYELVLMLLPVILIFLLVRFVRWSWETGNRKER